MKSFKQFVKEKYTPVVNITTTGFDVTIPEVKNEVNRNIDLIFNSSYVTVDEATNKLRKLLSMYNLDLPQLDTNDKKEDTIKLSVGHHHLGYDEFTGKIDNFVTTDLTFSYKLVDGLYKCKAELI